MHIFLTLLDADVSDNDGQSGQKTSIVLQQTPDVNNICIQTIKYFKYKNWKSVLWMLNSQRTLEQEIK